MSQPIPTAADLAAVQQTSAVTEDGTGTRSERMSATRIHPEFQS